MDIETGAGVDIEAGADVDVEAGARADVEAILAAHPAVGRVAVTAGPDGRPVARVVPDPAVRAATVRAAGSADEYVREWEGVYDALYDAAPAEPDADFSGWNSTYTGGPIPLAQMREWRAATVARIGELAPRRVLEVGVGSGLLLFPLAPRCEAYWGTDVSGLAVERLDELVQDDGELADRVVLRQLAAHELDDLPESFFDTVVINSVIQYFPGPGYLTDVLRRLFRLVAPGGVVFVGDVRDLRTHRCLVTAAQLAQAEQGVGAAELAARVDRAMRLEPEMLVHPDFFAALPAAIPGLESVDIRLKRGRAHNELTRHRYDVILGAAPRPPALPVRPLPLAWGADVTGRDDLAGRLAAARCPAVTVTGVPNARLARDSAALRALEACHVLRPADHPTGTGPNGGTGSFTGARPDGGTDPDGAARPEEAGHGTGAAPGADPGVDPEDLHDLGERLGYRVLVAPTGGDRYGAFDALFTRDRQAIAPYRAGPGAGTGRPPAGDPVAARYAADLESELRRLLRRRLPGAPPPTLVIEDS